MRIYRIVFTLIVLAYLSIQNVVCLPTFSLKNNFSENQSKCDSLFIDAIKQKVLGNYSQSIELFNDVIKINPQSSASYSQLAQIYVLTNDTVMALNFARYAEKLDNKNKWYKLQLAGLYKINGKIDSTIFVYKQLINLYPKEYEYSFSLFLLYIEQKKTSKALKLLNKLENEYGINDEIAIEQCKIYLQNKDRKNFIKTLKKSVKAFPDKPQFRELLINYYISVSQNDSALKYCTDLLKIDPNNENIIISTIDLYRNINRVDNSLDLAADFIADDKFSIDNKFRLIISFLEDQKNFKTHKFQIKSLIDTLLKHNNTITKLHTLSADFYLKTNKLKEARDELILIVSTYKSDYVIWEQLFYVLSSLNEFDTIYTLSNEALTIFENRPVIYLFNGISLFVLKKYDNALSSLLLGLKSENLSKDIKIQFFMYLGETYNALKDFDNSDKYFEMALKIDTVNILILNNYSYYLALRNNQLDKALVYSKKCVEYAPNNGTFLDTYGWVLYKAGRLNEAKQAIESAILNGGSQNSEIIEHYAEILIMLKKPDEALKYYKLIKDFGKDSERLKELLNISK